MVGKQEENFVHVQWIFIGQCSPKWSYRHGELSKIIVIQKNKILKKIKNIFKD